MAATYDSQNRTSFLVRNVSNVAVELTDEATAYNFAPGEAKTLPGELAVRLVARDGRLVLPDDSSSNLFAQGQDKDEQVANTP